MFETTENYIYESIEFDEKELNEQSHAFKVSAIYHQFKMEKLKGDLRYSRTDLLRPINEKSIFAEWLQGLPTNINIEFRTFEQAELLESWGWHTDDIDDIGELFYSQVTDTFYAMLEDINSFI